MAMSVEERRKRDRERKQKKRAAERAEREAAVTETKKNSSVTRPRMYDAVKSSLSAMKWLQASDDASVAQAKALAAEIDDLVDAGETTKALSAHRALSRVLNDLGGTPTVRLQHELRSLKLGRRSEEDDDEREDKTQEAGGAVISKFERPKKNARR